MKNNHYRIIKVFLVIATIGMINCSRQENSELCESTSRELEYDIIRRIAIEVDSANYNAYVSDVFEDGGLEYYYALCNNVISIYDLTNGKFNKSISLQDEGPQSVGNVSDFCITKDGSLYLLSENQLLLTFISPTGVMLKKWRINTENNSDVEGVISYNGWRMQAVGQEKILLRSFPAIEPNKTEFYEKGYILLYNLIKNEIDTLFGEYPGNYFKLKWSPVGMYNTVITSDGKRFFQSFPIDHHIWEYNISSNTKKNIYCARSKYIQEFDFISRDSDYQGEKNYTYSEPFYFDLLYDKYRNLFYRIVKLKQPLKNLDGLVNQYGNSPWSIIVLDKKLNVLGEVPMPKNIYKFTNINVVKSGLLISRDSDQNNKNVEDLLEFDIILIKI